MAESNQMLDVIWSHWDQLGLPGVVHSSDRTAIDPEPLLLFTPFLARHEPRLLDLTFAWCLQHHRWISSVRLRGLYKQAPQAVQAAFGQLARRLIEEGGPTWHHINHDGGRTGDYPTPRPSIRHLTVPLHRPSTVRLRARALFGAGSRPDAVCALLARPDHWHRARELDWLGYSRPSIDATLGDLVLAGTVATRSLSGVTHYQLRFAPQLHVMLDSQTLHWPDVRTMVTAMAAEIELGTFASTPDIVRRVQAAQVRDRFARLAANRGWQVPQIDGKPDAFELAMGWLRSRWIATSSPPVQRCERP